MNVLTMAQLAEAVYKQFDDPDEIREFERGRAEVLDLGDQSIARITFEPGWRWFEHVKPIAGTDSCQVAHTGFIVQGRLATRMDDGTEFELGPGSAATVPPGHDGWVVGDEPVVYVEFTGADEYAKR